VIHPGLRRAIMQGIWIAGLALIAGLGLIADAVTTQAAGEPPSQAPGANAIDYLPSITLTNQYGKALTLASLRGKPVLVSFIHTTCKGICELMTAKMKDVDADLGTKGTNVAMVSISTDPEHDGPAELIAYAKKEDVANNGFVFLTGEPAAIKQVLAIYGVNQHKGDTPMTHVLDLFLIGPNGRQIRHYHGLNVHATTVADDIQQTLAGE